jgi:hypothetical protein
VPTVRVGTRRTGGVASVPSFKAEIEVDLFDKNNCRDGKGVRIRTRREKAERDGTEAHVFNREHDGT